MAGLNLNVGTYTWTNPSTSDTIVLDIGNAPATAVPEAGEGLLAMSCFTGFLLGSRRRKRC